MSYRITCLEELKIPYIVSKKNVKRLTVKYNSNLILLIVQPYNIDDLTVIKFIEKNLDWIVKHKPIKPQPHETYHDGDIYLLLGREYKLEIVYSNHEGVVLGNEKIIVYTASDSRIEKLLNQFRFEQAELVFNEMLYKCFVNINDKLQQFPKMVIKKSKSRWGCCYLNDYKIMVNIALIHTPLMLIEYVIFHELIHFVHPNHSREFHLLLEKYVSNAKKKRNMLKNYCIIYK